jgi:hypothetical protein
MQPKAYKNLCSRAVSKALQHNNEYLNIVLHDRLLMTAHQIIAPAALISQKNMCLRLSVT